MEKMENNSSSRVLTVAELVAKAIENEGAVIHLKKAVVEYYKGVKGMTEKLNAAEETLKFVRKQRDEYEMQVWDFKNALINRDHEFSEVKKELAEANEENARLNHTIELALIEIEDIPDKPTKEHFRKCIIHIQNILGSLVKKKLTGK